MYHDGRGYSDSGVALLVSALALDSTANSRVADGLGGKLVSLPVAGRGSRVLCCLLSAPAVHSELSLSLELPVPWVSRQVPHRPVISGALDPRCFQARPGS